jgi:hypothetical protein
MGNHKSFCQYCGEELQDVGGLPICPQCNDRRGEHYNFLFQSISDFSEKSDKVLIECPGATLYHPGTNDIAGGVRFNNPDDPLQGYEIVGQPVYGPKHVRRRWVKKENSHLIRRCESCQDHTIRMRRKEGPDLYIPSRRGPQPRNRRSSTYPR